MERDYYNLFERLMSEEKYVEANALFEEHADEIMVTNQDSEVFRAALPIHYVDLAAYFGEMKDVSRNMHAALQTIYGNNLDTILMSSMMASIGITLQETLSSKRGFEQ
jgi:hypothetical protein